VVSQAYSLRIIDVPGAAGTYEVDINNNVDILGAYSLNDPTVNSGGRGGAASPRNLYRYRFPWCY
jgi:hypothetical protein